jgi:hypothetical protein
VKEEEVGVRVVLIAAIVAVLAVILVGCSSNPEASMASDMCAVLTDFKEAPEDEASVISTEQAIADLALRGQADGVDMGQVAAKIELDCTDAYAYFLNEQQEIVDVLQGILSDLDG